MAVRAYPRGKKLQWSTIWKIYYILGRIQVKWGVGKQLLFILETAGGLEGEGCYSPKNILQFSPSIFTKETVFPELKLPQNCYINSIVFLENWLFNHKLTSPLLHCLWKTILTIWQYESNMKGTSKVSISKLFIELGQIWRKTWNPNSLD